MNLSEFHYKTERRERYRALSAFLELSDSAVESKRIMNIFSTILNIKGKLHNMLEIGLAIFGTQYAVIWPLTIELSYDF